MEQGVALKDPGITVFLADDSLLVREGVRARCWPSAGPGGRGDGGRLRRADPRAEGRPTQVIVTDIRMPPAFQREGIDAAKQVRKRHPGTGVVVLSQYDDPEYAISLLREGSQGYAYLLKDRVDQGEQLARAIRAVAVGGSMLDPAIAEALVTPVSDAGDLTGEEERLLQLVAEGRRSRRSRVSRRTTPAAAEAAVEGRSSSWPGRRPPGPTAPCAGCACSTRHRGQRGAAGDAQPAAAPVV